LTIEKGSFKRTDPRLKALANKKEEKGRWRESGRVPKTLKVCYGEQTSRGEGLLKNRQKQVEHRTRKNYLTKLGTKVSQKELPLSRGGGRAMTWGKQARKLST